MYVTVVADTGMVHRCAAPVVSFSDGFVLINRAFIAALAMLALAPPAAAEATVAEVMAACARSAKDGARGVDAAFCEWHALPCACKLSPYDEATPRWCYPEPLDEAAALTAVTAALAAAPGDAPAGRTVPEILARLYPCDQAGAAP